MLLINKIKQLEKKISCLKKLIEENKGTFDQFENYSSLPDASLYTDVFVHVLNSQGTEWLPWNWGGTYRPSGLYYSNGITWEYSGKFPFEATQAQVNAGILNDRFVTPLTLKNSTQWGGKADSIHTHSSSDILDFQTQVSNNSDVISSKQKLSGIEDGAEVNVNADWNSISGDSQILNKPSTFPPDSHNHTTYDSFGFSIRNGVEVIPIDISSFLRAKSNGSIEAYRIDLFDEGGLLTAGTMSLEIKKNNVTIGTVNVNNQSTVYEDNLLTWIIGFLMDDIISFSLISNDDVTNFLFTVYFNKSI